MSQPHDPSAPDPSTPPSQPPAGQPERYELLWHVEDDESGAWDLPARFELVRDLGDGPAGPMFVVRDAQHAGLLLRLDVLARSEGLDAAQRDALAARVQAVGRVKSHQLSSALEVGPLPDGRSFVLSEHVEGESAGNRLAREGHLHTAHALEIARQVLSALAALHGAGAAHGALDSNCVWLAHHAPKRDDNPFGVRVLLLGAGVAQRAPQEAALDDLRQVGELLGVLLGNGSDVSEQARATRAFARSLVGSTRAESNGAARALNEVEQLLGVQSRQRENAGANRALRFAVAAVSLGCLALGWSAWTSRVRAESLAREARDERGRFEAMQRDALGRIDLLRGELAAGENALRRQLDELEGALVRSDDLRARTERLEAMTAEQLERERTRATALESDLAERTAALAAAREQLSAALARSESSVRAARGLDASLELFKDGEGARARVRALALEAEGLFGARNEFISSLASALESLTHFERARSSQEAGELDIAAVDEALRAFARAAAQREAFLAEAAPWIDLELSDAPARARRERLDEAFEALRGRVQVASSERELAHERDLFVLRGAPASDGPERAFAHAERFGCDHFEEFGARFVRELRESVAMGGVLDARRLEAQHQLAAWAERSRRGEVRLAGELARDLELLDAARRWYDDQPLLESQLALARSASQLADGSPWRQQLALQWALSDALAQPAPPGLESWRVDLDPSGRREWWRERVEALDGDVQVLRRTRFAGDGLTTLGEARLRLEVNAARMRWVGSRSALIDVRALGERVWVDRTPQAEELDAPEVLALDAAALRAVREQSAGELCLVFRQGDIERWISPRLGLVREEVRTPEGLAITQLVAMAR